MIKICIFYILFSPGYKFLENIPEVISTKSWNDLEGVHE